MDPQYAERNPWQGEADDGINSFFIELDKAKENIHLDLPGFSDFSLADETGLTSLPLMPSDSDLSPEAPCKDRRVTFADGFDLFADQYERNNKMEDAIHRLEILNSHPNALKKNGTDVLHTAIRLLVDVLDFVVDRQTELCHRLTLVANQGIQVESIPVHADHQTDFVNSLSRIVAFVNKLKEHLTKADLFPTLCSRLEELIPNLMLTDDSFPRLQNHFVRIEEARNILLSLTTQNYTVSSSVTTKH